MNDLTTEWTNPQGLIDVDAIAAASPRVETIIFGPADFMASINMRTLIASKGRAAGMQRSHLWRAPQP